jgi:hypothetical protein
LAGASYTRFLWQTAPPDGHDPLKWSEPGNWTPNGVPGQADTATIGGGKTIISGAVTVQDLTVGGATLGGAGTLTINHSLTMNGGTLAITGVVSVAANATWTLANKAGNSLVNCVVNLDGKATLSEGYLTFQNAIINNGAGAEFTAADGTILTQTTQVLGGTFNNSGVFNKGPGTNVTMVYLIFTNKLGGSVSVPEGTLTFGQGPVTSTGTFAADTPATIVFGPPGLPHVLEPGTQLGGDGVYRVEANALMVLADLSVYNLQLNGVGVTIGASNVLDVVNCDWNSGAITGPGEVHANFLNIAGSDAKTVQNARINVSEAGVWSGTGNIYCSPGSVISLTSPVTGTRPTFTALNDANMVITGGGPTNAPPPQFLNHGLFVKTNSTRNGFTTFDRVDFNNADTVNIQQGALALSGGTSIGEFLMEAGAEVQFFQGVHQLVGSSSSTNLDGATFTGAGFGGLAGGTVVVTTNTVYAQNFVIASGELQLPRDPRVRSSQNTVSTFWPLHPD